MGARLMDLEAHLFLLEQALQSPRGEGACSRWAAKLPQFIHRIHSGCVR